MAQATVKAHKRKGKIVKQHKRKVDDGTKPAGPMAGKEFKTISEKMAFIRSHKGTQKANSTKGTKTPQAPKAGAAPKVKNAPIPKKAAVKKDIQKKRPQKPAANKPAPKSLPVAD